MRFDLIDWLHLFLRWFHVIAGITWIGQTHLFNTLERWMAEDLSKEGDNIAGNVWMVHGGGFYFLQKQKIPALMPQKLRWFKWQSGLTWISGILLILLIFYYEGALSPKIDQGKAIAVGLGVMILAWPAYTLFWQSPLGKHEIAGATMCYVLILALAYGLTHVLGDRAMYLHIGGMLGTIMAGNVWLIIIPSQRHLVEAIKAGRLPDMTLAARAKQASRHNSFMAVPVIFTMISSHFPMSTFASPYNWQILGLLILVGWAGAKIMRR